jgi:ABC-type amino acid transport system permease subunit
MRNRISHRATTAPDNPIGAAVVANDAISAFERTRQETNRTKHVKVITFGSLFLAAVAGSLWVSEVNLAQFVEGFPGLVAYIRGTLPVIRADHFVTDVAEWYWGLGPFAGVLAIAVSDTGTLAKLFAEAIETVDRRQIEGVQASGANRIQLMRFAILPQVLPVMLSHALYYFESNTRSATILGIVGAGGIGLQLADRIRVNNWDEVAFILIMILITVTVIDLISKAIRHRIIQAGEASTRGRAMAP